MEKIDKLEECAETITCSSEPYIYESAREKLMREMRKNTKEILDAIDNDKISFTLVSAVAECLGEYTSLTGDDSIVKALSLWLGRQSDNSALKDIALYTEEAERIYSSLYIIQ